MYSCHVWLLSNTQGSFVRFIVKSLMYSCHVSLLSNTQGSFVRFIIKTGLDKIVAHLTNNSLFKKRFFNRPIRFPGSNFDSGEINGNVIGSARSKDVTAWARGLSPISTTYSDVPCRWRARRPLASRVYIWWLKLENLYTTFLWRHQIWRHNMTFWHFLLWKWSRH